MRAIGIKEFYDKKFDCYELTGQWLEHIGRPEKNFAACISGFSANGKTDYCIKMAKMFAILGYRVLYNSFEEGISATLQEAIKRNNLIEVSGKITFCHKETFSELVDRLSNRNSASIVFIDSRDDMDLTYKQFRILQTKFKNKAFIIICWEGSGGLPKGEYGKSIRYKSDIKIRVSDYIAYPKSRFGGNKNFIIWNKQPKSGDQLKLV